MRDDPFALISRRLAHRQKAPMIEATRPADLFGGGHDQSAKATATPATTAIKACEAATAA